MDGCPSRRSFESNGGLRSARIFGWIANVPPADDQVTSLTAIGGSAYRGPVAFTTTHWSVVLEAQGPSPTAQAALEKLCRTYWRPIYGYVRRPTKAQVMQTPGLVGITCSRKDEQTSFGGVLVKGLDLLLGKIKGV